MRRGCLAISALAAMHAATTTYFATAAENTAQTRVKVVTVTKDGLPAVAKITVRAPPAEDRSASVFNEGDGFKIISLDKCDDGVLISAEPVRATVVRNRRDNVADWLSCKSEVIFNDFIYLSVSVSADRIDFQRPEFWTEALGTTAVEMSPGLPMDIADAFAKQEYGKISIIATELEKRVRAAGKKEDADFLYSIAVDAGARGVFTAAGKSIDPMTDILEYSPDRNRFELSPDARRLLETYQIQSLGVTQNSNNLGRLTWQTMTSLPGGEDVRAPQYQLSPDAAANFNSQLLQELRVPEF